MLAYVCDADPTLNQHKFNILCLLEKNTYIMVIIQTLSIRIKFMFQRLRVDHLVDKIEVNTFSIGN